MTTEKKLEIARNLLPKKEYEMYLNECRLVEIASEEKLCCPHCESQIEHEMIQRVDFTDEWVVEYEYKCMDCGEHFIEHLERTEIKRH